MQPSLSVPDFGRTAQDYRRFRVGFPAELLGRLLDHGIGNPDQDVVDIGTGTGTLARLLATRVRSVRGVDPSQELMDEAKELDTEVGVDVAYTVGTAEKTHLETASADVVTAGQCWHWFDADRASTEIARILRPEGFVAIAHFDWLPLPGNVVEATERLIEHANPCWTMGGGTGLYPRWLTDLSRTGFRDLETFSFDVDIAYPCEAWVGRIRASAGIGGSLTDEDVDRFSSRLRSLLLTEYPGDVLLVPHRTWVVVARRGADKPPTTGMSA